MHTMKRTQFFLMLLLYCSMASLAAIVVAAQNNNVTTDQLALLALKAHITSDPRNILTNWSTTTSFCNWVGVTCVARNFGVTGLNISYFGLTGTIPPELGNLTFLVQLDFANNSFHGTLPMELSRLHQLKLINFGYNNFKGTIPSLFKSLSKLQTFICFVISFHISGSLPTEIFNLSALEKIDLTNNHLSGT